MHLQPGEWLCRPMFLPSKRVTFNECRPLSCFFKRKQASSRHKLILTTPRRLPTVHNLQYGVRYHVTIPPRSHYHPHRKLIHIGPSGLSIDKERNNRSTLGRQATGALQAAARGPVLVVLLHEWAHDLKEPFKARYPRPCMLPRVETVRASARGPLLTDD